MRRILTVAASVLACGSLLSLAPAAPVSLARAAQGTPAACAPASPDANRQVALDWFQAITDHDLGRFDTLMTADAHYGAATVADSVGPEGAREIYQGVLDGFPNIVYIPGETVAADDYVAVRYIAEGDNTGAFRGTPATGKHAAWHGIGIMRFDCGKIAEGWMEIDQIARMQAIGTAKDMPAMAALTDPGVPETAGSAASPQPAAACPAPTRREAEQVYFLWDEVWDTGDVALLDGMLTEQAAASDADGNSRSLQEDLTAAVAAYKTAMPGLSDTTQVVFAEGDLVVARWTGAGRMTGDFLGIPATGEPVTYTGHTMLRIECGRIADAWTETDAASMLDQMKADWRN